MLHEPTAWKSVAQSPREKSHLKKTAFKGKYLNITYMLKTLQVKRGKLFEKLCLNMHTSKEIHRRTRTIYKILN